MEELDRINIQTTSSEGQTLQTVVNNGPINLTTQVSDVPQIQTVLQDNISPIASVINNPFVEVTSINGMTGDVVVEPIIKPFQNNHYYLKDSVITYNGTICIAKQTFTSGESFNPDDWNIPDFTQEQADWNENDSASKSYIKNKPTIPTVNNGVLTVQKNGIDVATFSANTAINTTANISVPTKTSEITNDSGFIKSSDLPTVNNGVLTIQKNSTTIDTFTANSATNKTVNIETITAETVAPAEEVGAITASMIDWTTMPGSYSTTEQKTPFIWIDGKPIYKKTIDFGSLPNNSTKNVAHGISNLGDLIDIRGTAKTSWGTYQLPLVFSGSDVNYITNVSVDATNISMANSADRSGFTAYVTLWYTKTTD